jgi:hypothetical protein
MKYLLQLALASACALTLIAQTKDYGRDFRGVLDANQSTRSRPFRTVTTAPSGSCTTVEWAWSSTASNLYYCPAGTWAPFPFATLAGTETLTNKTLTLPVVTAYAAGSLPTAGTVGRLAVATSAGSACNTSGSNTLLCRDNGTTWIVIAGGSGSGLVPITGDSGTVTVDAGTGKVDADIVQIDAQPHAFTSVADLSSATVAKPFKRVTTAPSGSCSGSANAIQMVKSTGAKWRCDEDSALWVADGGSATQTTWWPLAITASTYPNGDFFAGSAGSNYGGYGSRYVTMTATGFSKANWVIDAPATLPASITVSFWVGFLDNSTSTNIRFNISTACQALTVSGYTGPTVVETVAQTIAVPATNYHSVRVTATISTAGCAGKLLFIDGARDGDHAADTWASSAYLRGGTASWTN